MKILFTTQALSIGGIEVLALRLSEAFAKAGHDVILYDFNPDRRNPGLVSSYDTKRFRLAALEPSPVLNGLLWKAHALLFKTGINREFRPRLIERHFARLLARERPDIICSLSFHQDYQACRYASELGIPVVVSMHGTYEYAASEWPQRAHFIYDHVQAIIYAADKNMSWYESQSYLRPELPVYKIYTGTDLHKPIPQTSTRVGLGIASDAFVYILVARGIQEKGWEEALQAFRGVRARYARAVLLLVGEGEYLAALRLRYAAEPGVLFYGSHPNSLELTALADAGLLPSYFPIETLPNVIIDYLRCGLPVLASDIGEIPNMLTLPDGSVAGAVLPRSGHQGGVEVSALQQAMEQLLADSEWYQQQAARARLAAQRFDLQVCVEQYTAVFHQALKIN
ncbi:glycosyltransferase family 4 protein [Hymenobacter canadensis]|uniref:Glycosyltransferase family 4 protein n=1 Tax=Hymenobacter canadensis TaxID=2999067 RepID=A0ABY7LPV7_9BACT|nr:glycosyltransferase family 4 protein [Hymenobacter canadensis]WBA41967.1 glycosyltransferase family 4 protein [Hymenobacter canadensis]